MQNSGTRIWLFRSFPLGCGSQAPIPELHFPDNTVNTITMTHRTAKTINPLKHFTNTSTLPLFPNILISPLTRTHHAGVHVAIDP